MNEWYWHVTNVGRFAPSPVRPMPVRTKSGSFRTKLWVVSLQTLVVSLHRSHLEFYMLANFISYIFSNVQMIAEDV
jgi:hypothetical protein